MKTKLLCSRNTSTHKGRCVVWYDGLLRFGALVLQDFFIAFGADVAMLLGMTSLLEIRFYWTPLTYFT